MVWLELWVLTVVGEIVSVLKDMLGHSSDVRAQASGASLSARGMLGKASEVAAAAEQSALAMREDGASPDEVTRCLIEAGFDPSPIAHLL